LTSQLPQPPSLSGAAAQQPGRTITTIVPHASERGYSRVLGEELQQRWGQPVVIENKPGASGNIGTQVRRALADGHTLMLTTRRSPRTSRCTRRAG
jgi:tripartite-type tricarboxylate transporter receptor subunit TctC